MSLESNISPQWLDEQYRLWQENPTALDEQWQAFFKGFDLAQETEFGDRNLAARNSAVDSLIYRYRDLGHLMACTDPLSPCPVENPLLALRAFELEEKDLDTTFFPLRFPQKSATLREIIALLHDTYCRSIGVEFMHIQNPQERQWLKDQMEGTRNRPNLTRDEKLAILAKLQEGTQFEDFLHKKFLGQKRFSLEGAEVLIPLLESLVEKAAELGVSDLVMGMSHRGRLNVLANIFTKPFENIFAEFKDNLELAFVGEGDVKYHKGYSVDRTMSSGNTIHLSLAANPSHLEVIDPVVIGKCRARHSNYGPGGRQRVLPVLIHGDAAFAGQGIVPEVLNLSQLDGYQSGGTIHIVVNNQIGFTTDPAHARSTLYATDVAKMLMIPIFHVNGEDPEAAVYATQLALEYRQRYRKDVVIEFICYRRHGHNEGDEPFFTQPVMYEKIRRRPPLHEVYASKLLEDGLAPQAIAQQLDSIRQRLETAFTAEPKEQEDLGFQAKWRGVQREYTPETPETQVPAERLRSLAGKLAAIPPGFQAHPKIAKLLQKRQETVEQGSEINWATAEALAFATLLTEGHPIRLSGQDSRRGTFNHRHSTLVDQNSGRLHVPLAFLEPGQAFMQVYDSMLSEAAVLGFEYGYSLEEPNGLTIWEAQFGDFANGAQVIIDQFLPGSGTKWDRFSGLTLYLPHGYEGQGPEHSSARIERYLQLCADNNLLVANPSTPAQLFHLLRRQVLQPYRRPLIVFTPKSLLRHPQCSSPLSAFTEEGFLPFRPAMVPLEGSKTLLFCSGKLVYDLQAQIEEEQRTDIAVLCVEQLYPFRDELLRDQLAHFGQVDQYAWVQEEPENMGAWSFVRPLLTRLLGQEPIYVGRPASATTAVGSHRRHQQEQKQLVQTALNLQKDA